MDRRTLMICSHNIDRLQPIRMRLANVAICNNILNILIPARKTAGPAQIYQAAPVVRAAFAAIALLGRPAGIYDVLAYWRP